MNTIKYLTFFLCATLTMFTACTSDAGEKTPEVTAANLIGHWQLSKAYRDNQETESLEGTYMKFSIDQKMTCNFIGEEINSAFTFKNNEIVQGKQTYTVENFSPSELSVSTKLMNFNFKLVFTKTEE